MTPPALQRTATRKAKMYNAAMRLRDKVMFAIGFAAMIGLILLPFVLRIQPHG